MLIKIVLFILIGVSSNVTVTGRQSKTYDAGFSFLLIPFRSFSALTRLEKIGIHLATVIR